MQTIERAFAVLRALAEQTESAGVSEVARRADLPKSTTSRILASLEDLGMVERRGDRYAIGAGLATLTHDASPVASLRDIARPYMVALSEVVAESVALAVPDGDEMLYIDTASSTGVVQVEDWTGRRFPFHTVAAGFALMTTWIDDDLEVYGQRDFERFTPTTVGDLPELRSRMELVRRDGYAWTRAEFSEEVNGVAAPIHDRDGLAVGAINISGPIYRFPGDRPESEIVDDLVSACRQIGNRL